MSRKKPTPPTSVFSRSCGGKKDIGGCDMTTAWASIPSTVHTKNRPRDWRRAAAWLRKVADWWDYLADEEEMKRTQPRRLRLIVCDRGEGQ
jgi:hypothetical protein